MKRPPESAISESDLRQRIVQLERIVEQQTARIGAGAGIGPPQGTVPPRCPGRLVAIGRFLLASHRRLPTPILGALAGRTARARRTRPLVGIGRAGGRTDPGQAQQLPPMRAPFDGRRSSSAASPGSRHPAAAGRGHRVSVAHPALRSLRPPDRSRLARGRIAPHLRSQRASLGGPAGRGLPAEQAQHPGAVVRRLRPRGVAGYRQPTGTGGGRGPGGSGRGGARLRSPTGRRQRRRDRLAAGPRQGLVVDRGDGRRLGVRHSPKPGTGTGVDEVLGADNRAVVGSDRYSAYGPLPLRRRQVCWAHLRRTFEEFVARGGEAAWVGQRLLDSSDQLFTRWHRVRDGTLRRSSFQVYVSGWRGRFHTYLGYSQQVADAKTAATCGTHSADGSRFVERLLTVRDTLRQQQRNVLDYLRVACQAAVSQQSAPSLLPSTHSVIR